MHLLFAFDVHRCFHERVTSPLGWVLVEEIQYSIMGRHAGYLGEGWRTRVSLGLSTMEYHWQLKNQDTDHTVILSTPLLGLWGHEVQLNLSASLFTTAAVILCRFLPVRRLAPSKPSLDPPRMRLARPIPGIAPPIQRLPPSILWLAPPIQWLPPPMQWLVPPIQWLGPPIQWLGPPMRWLALPILSLLWLCYD